MSSKLKTAAAVVGLGVALNLTGVSTAFAVWCQADAPMVYENLLTSFMPFITKLTGVTGTSIESAVEQSGAAERGEVLKATLADKQVHEGIAAYEQQEDLRNRAADLSASMQQPADTCVSMAAATSLTTADQTTQVNAFRTQAKLMTKLAPAAQTSALTSLDTSYKSSNSSFCTPQEAAQGICTTNSSSTYKNLAGADQDAMFLFQSADGSSSFEGNGAAQSDADDAYISRVVGGIPAQALQKTGTDYYKKNPQARAYAEMSRRYAAMLSMPAYALAQIKEMHKVQTGLGNDTMLATVNVGGFAANKADMSMSEAVERFVATKFSPDSVADLAKAEKPETILRSMAQMESFDLWLAYQGLRQSSVTEGLQAHQLILMADQTLRPQLDAQRLAATRANATR